MPGLSWKTQGPQPSAIRIPLFAVDLHLYADQYRTPHDEWRNRIPDVTARNDLSNARTRYVRNLRWSVRVIYGP